MWCITQGESTVSVVFFFFFFHAEDGIREAQESRGLGDVYKRQGIGSDFDGGGGLADCIDVGEFPKITMELLRRGYVEEDIIKIWGGNFLRVMEEIQNKAG